MRAIFFGKLADRLDRTVSFDAGGACTVGEVRALLAERHPQASADLLAPSLRACVRDAIVGDDHPVGGEDTIEFFPPVSGG